MDHGNFTRWPYPPRQADCGRGDCGSGKSTQLDLLRKYLIGEGYCVAFSEWNSSSIVGGVTRRGKKKGLLTPLSFCLIHAADFADRMERQMLPAPKAGAIVLADRYFYL